MGLLDIDLNNPQTAAQLALVSGLLGTPGNFGRGLGASLPAALGAFAETRKAGMQQKLAEAQLADLTAQAAQRQAIAARQQRILDQINAWGGPGAQPAAGVSGPDALRQGASVGDVGPTVTNAARMVPSQGAGASQMFGIPLQAIQADLAFGEGKGIAGMIEKRSAPNWQNVNGVMVNTNDPSFRGGFQPGLTVSQDGKATMTTVGPDGQPRVSAPLGALSTYGAYRRAESDAKPMQVYNPKLGGMIWTTEGDVLAGTRPPPAVIGGDLADPGTQFSSPRVRAVAQGAAGVPAGAAPGGFQAAPTEEQKLAQTLRQTTVTDAHKANQQGLNDLSESLRNEAELQNRNANLIPLLQKFKTGGLMPEERVHFANAIGNTEWLPEKVRNAIASGFTGGDPAIGKTIENQLATAGIQTMLDALQKEGKPNRAIFMALQQAQEGLKSGNVSLGQVFGIQKQLYDWHLKQQQELAGRMAASDYNPLLVQQQFPAFRASTIGPSTMPAEKSSGAAATAAPAPAPANAAPARSAALTPNQVTEKNIQHTAMLKGWTVQQVKDEIARRLQGK